jgi:predicted RNA-binding protein
MCEANAYVQKNGKEDLVMASVDLIEPQDEGKFLLKSIFGEQKIIQGNIKSMNLVDHKIIFIGNLQSELS